MTTKEYQIEHIDSETLVLNGRQLTRNSDNCCRYVYMDDKYVVKFDLDADEHSDVAWTSRQSLREVHFYYNILEKRDRKYFATIIHHGRLTHNGKQCYYVIQKKINYRVPKRKYLSDAVVTKAQETLTNLRVKYKLADIGSINRWNSTHNACVANSGILKIFDYAGGNY